MDKTADLHVHTTLSDGTFSPEKVVEYSKEQGLSAISITDHDCCDAIRPAIKKGDSIELEVIPGVEMTAELGEDEMHILGYFIDWQNPSFIKRLKEISRIREERARRILKKLRDKGLDILDEELFQLSGAGSVGRLHIAHLLVKKGYVSSITRAFRDYIGNNGPCYVSKFKMTPKEAIDMINKFGGVSILAHPGTINTKNRTIEETMEFLIKDGIKGIEVYHSDHNKAKETKFMDIAKRYSLLMAGGSDCHGLAKKDVLIGRVKIPYHLVEAIKDARPKRK
ncbi:MAG: PHP domain-containing protein [Candidatus Omnitrophota bacterium]